MNTEELDSNLRNELKKRYHCFVLITCTAPSKKGEMQVNLTYEGDESLAAFLVEGAQSAFEPEKSSHERVD